MKYVKLSEDDFDKILEKMFLKGMDLGESYRDWIVPSRETIDNGINNTKQTVLNNIKICYSETK